MPEVTITDEVERPTAVIREVVAVDGLKQFFDRVFQATAMVAGEAIDGPPFAMYHGMPTDLIDVEAGFPVRQPIDAMGEVRPGVLPAGRVYQAVHVGPYEDLQQTYALVAERMAADGAVPVDVMWECYLSDPSREPDPSLWRTLVCCPVTG